MFAQRNKQLFISFISALAATLSLASQEALAGEWSVGASILGGRNPIVGEGAAAALLPTDSLDRWCRHRPPRGWDQ